MVVSVADAEPGPSTLFASRYLCWLATQRRVRTVLVLGAGGRWRDRLPAAVVLGADELDDWWAPRLWAHLPSRRGHRQLRWLRSMWWRARLRFGRARLVPASGPLPGSVARSLPRWMQRRTVAPTPPLVLAPSVETSSAHRSSVAGLGALCGRAGTDLWLRAVHALRQRDGCAVAVWHRSGPEDQDVHRVDHERWHLGLDEVVRLRPVDDDTGFALADASVLVLSARPGHDPFGELDGVPGGAWLLRTGQLPVVRFEDADVSTAAPEGATSVAVPYPDVEAMAVATSQVSGPDRAEVDRRLGELLVVGRR